MFKRSTRNFLFCVRHGKFFSWTKDKTNTTRLRPYPENKSNHRISDGKATRNFFLLSTRKFFFTIYTEIFFTIYTEIFFYCLHGNFFFEKITENKLIYSLQLNSFLFRLRRTKRFESYRRKAPEERDTARIDQAATRVFFEKIYIAVKSLHK